MKSVQSNVLRSIFLRNLLSITSLILISSHNVLAAQAGLECSTAGDALAGVQVKIGAFAKGTVPFKVLTYSESGLPEHTQTFVGGLTGADAKSFNQGAAGKSFSVVVKDADAYSFGGAVINAGVLVLNYGQKMSPGGVPKVSALLSKGDVVYKLNCEFAL